MVLERGRLRDEGEPAGHLYAQRVARHVPGQVRLRQAALDSRKGCPPVFSAGASAAGTDLSALKQLFDMGKVEVENAAPTSCINEGFRCSYTYECCGSLFCRNGFCD